MDKKETITILNNKQRKSGMSIVYDTLTKDFPDLKSKLSGLL